MYVFSFGALRRSRLIILLLWVKMATRDTIDTHWIMEMSRDWNCWPLWGYCVVVFSILKHQWKKVIFRKFFTQKYVQIEICFKEDISRTYSNNETPLKAFSSYTYHYWTENVEMHGRSYGNMSVLKRNEQGNVITATEKNLEEPDSAVPWTARTGPPVMINQSTRANRCGGTLLLKE